MEPSGALRNSAALWSRGQELWTRHQSWLQPALFLAGAGLDYATLRIYRWFDQILIVAYLLVLVGAWALEMRQARGRAVPRLVDRNLWVVEMASSVFLGALLSALGIVVLRATYPGPAVLFVALLFGMAAANEAGVRALHGDVSRYVLTAFFTYQLTTLLVPFVTASLPGPGPGIAAAALVTVAMVGLVEGRDVARVAREEPLRLLPIAGAVAGVLAIIALNWLQLVPPLPLILRDAVVARSVELDEAGYRLVDARRRSVLEQVWRGPPAIDWTEGQTVAVFTAVYAPPAMALELTSVWEVWEPEREEWSPRDRIEQTVAGGRARGWRSWTHKENLSHGAWRVRIETAAEREIGRIRFDVVAP